MCGGTDAAAEAAKEPVSQEEADKDAEAASPPAPQDRKPGIRFPNRRTPEGKRVSMLSFQEQQRYLSTLLCFHAAVALGYTKHGPLAAVLHRFAISAG